jgi:hypothetical protein
MIIQTPTERGQAQASILIGLHLELLGYAGLRQSAAAAVRQGQTKVAVVVVHTVLDISTMLLRLYTLSILDMLELLLLRLGGILRLIPQPLLQKVGALEAQTHQALVDSQVLEQVKSKLTVARRAARIILVDLEQEAEAVEVLVRL